MIQVETLVHREHGGDQGFTVEFVCNTGEIATVTLPQNGMNRLNPVSAVNRARELMAELTEKPESRLPDNVVPIRRVHGQHPMWGPWKNN